MITIGKRRERIALQSRDAGQDGFGQPADTWTTYATVWARVRSLAGNEQFKAQQFAPEVTHEVTVTWQAGLTDDITPLDRVSFGAKTFDILYCNYGERRLDDVVLLCKERVGTD